MTDLQETTRQQIASLFILFLVLIAGLFFSNFLAFAFAFPLANFDLTVVAEIVKNPLQNPETKEISLIIGGINSLGLFALSPLFFLRYFDKTSTPQNLLYRFDQRILFFLTFLLVIIAMPSLSHLIKWNENLILPDFFEDFENWAKAKENKMKEITLFLLDFESGTQFFLAMIVIAVVPALGEELLFRGILQHKLFVIFKNIHVAIWLTAFLFSAFHFQFYGLIPRMVLGAMFGYLYFWSKNLFVPILAHFINNGFTLLMMYLFKLELSNLNMDSEAAPIQYAILSLIFLGILLFFIKKLSKKEEVIL
ncbi:MAG: CPBP family intramembrane metalloprotease [Bacteroidetes bacterium]|nr:MAG: CPBP family intramembrane metalloprotease [Bacteroidota bacterium]